MPSKKVKSDGVKNKPELNKASQNIIVRSGATPHPPLQVAETRSNLSSEGAPQSQPLKTRFLASPCAIWFRASLGMTVWVFQLSLLWLFLSSSISSAEIVDRIAATVNDEVITLSELKERAAGEKRDEKEVLEGMINRVLILSEAKRLGISGTGEVGIDSYKYENVIIDRFIERRIKAFVLIPIEKAREFYEKNKEGFKGKDFSEVRDDINLYLIEEETNRRLKEFLIETKKKSDIRREL